jgi:hypothetical protein
MKLLQTNKTYVQLTNSNFRILCAVVSNPVVSEENTPSMLTQNVGTPTRLHCVITQKIHR